MWGETRKTTVWRLRYDTFWIWTILLNNEQISDGSCLERSTLTHMRELGWKLWEFCLSPTISQPKCCTIFAMHARKCSGIQGNTIHNVFLCWDMHALGWRLHNKVAHKLRPQQSSIPYSKTPLELLPFRLALHRWTPCQALKRIPHSSVGDPNCWHTIYRGLDLGASVIKSGGWQPSSLIYQQ